MIKLVIALIVRLFNLIGNGFKALLIKENKTNIRIALAVISMFMMVFLKEYNLLFKV